MPKEIGITDVKGATVHEGDKVRITIEDHIHPWERFTIREGIIKYRGKDLSSLGCGYGIEDGQVFNFLACYSHNCQIEVIEAGKIMVKSLDDLTAEAEKAGFKSLGAYVDSCLDENGEWDPREVIE